MDGWISTTHDDHVIYYISGIDYHSETEEIEEIF